MIAPILLVRRLSLALAIAIACASTAALTAQIPTRNVNMVSGLVWPHGDPFLQRQNEPSMAASTRNPLHLLAGSNDYRSVDLPIVLSDVDGEVGDAWLGLYKSTDGGERWTSTLLPGYPHDPSLEGQTSPINGFHAAADPVVRAGTNGLIYYAGLAFDRTPPGAPPGKSAIFVSRFIDNNNQEAGDPIEYINTSLVFSNPGGATNVFLDKPWMAVDIPRAGAGTCSITTSNEHGAFTQHPPAGNVYVAFTVKSIDAQGDRWDLYFSRSTNCGALFSAPIRISRAADRVNQGATIVIAPNTGAVSVAWRRIDLAADGEEDHAIVVARSTDFGVRWDPPGVARRFPRGKKVGLDPAHFQDKGKKKNAVVSQTDVTTDLVPFDQGSSASGLSFRTNAYPTMAADATGRLYLAWTERQLANDPARPELTDGDARILLSTSADGAAWSAPIVVHDVGQLGHQIMPALSFAGGKLMVAYYDLQEDRSAVFTKHIDDQTAFARTSPDRRHTIDIRVSMGTPGPSPVFEHSRSVSAYMMGARGPTGLPEQMQINPPNLPLFKLGTTPFIGDYIDIAPSPAFVPNGTGGWIYNTASTTTPPVFHVAWTDNRDVKPPFDRDWTKYTPPHYDGPRPEHGPGEEVAICLNGYAGSRNQNIYTARVTGGLVVGSPQNAKPLNTQFARAFVVFARNTTDTLAPRVFRMTILNQPPNGRASFSQFPAPPFGTGSAPPLTVIDVTVPRLSSASRTVYVTSSDPHAPVNVDVSEITAVGGSEIVGGLEGTIYLNLDVSNPEVDNPEVDNPEVDNPEVDNAEVYNPEVDNPEVDNPEVDNPEVDNPEVDNPEVDNPEVDNIEVGNPEIDNPEVDNPEVDNPEVDNPEVDNPEVDNGAILENGGIVTDITWKVRNIGNTTTAYNVNLFLRRATLPQTGTAQLLIYRTYKTPIIRQASCDVATTTQNVLQVNIPSPTLVLSDGDPSDPNDSDENHATLWLEPGGEILVDLRVSDPDVSNNIIVDGASIDPDWVPQRDVFLILQAQPVNTPDIPPGSGPIEPPLVEADPVPPIVVTTTADGGPGSLRDAIAKANSTPGMDTIVFNIAGAGPHTIEPLNTFGPITEAVVIDGSTQPGYAGLPLIVLDGSSTGGGSALRIEGGGSLVRGLALNNWGDFGINLLNNGSNRIFGNFIGTNAAGTAAVVNGQGGISINTNYNVIGGLAPLDRNLLSGNAFAGIFLTANNNLIEGNYIGPDVTGTAAIQNSWGILVFGPSSNNVISGNTISGNFAAGVVMGGTGINGNQFVNNRIGLNAAGNAALGNGDDGVTLLDGAGATVFDGNLISGNGGRGVDITNSGAPVSGTVFRNNIIGLDANGLDAGNFLGGIRVDSAPNTRIGEVFSSANIIAGNGGPLPMNIGNGIDIVGVAVPVPIIQNNRIGTDPTGMLPRPNVNKGISLDGPAQVGGANPGEGNLIAAHTDPGGGAGVIVLLGGSNSVIQGNVIGLDAAGGPLGNGYSGITVAGNNVLIGGTGVGAGNVISGNDNFGVSVLPVIGGDPDPVGVVIEGNRIGTNQTGTLFPGNGTAGINITGTGHRIGTAVSFFGSNIITHSGAQGIRVYGNANVMIGTNEIYDNGALGIDLNFDGVTGNDVSDPDAGPNQLQNYPVISSALKVGALTTISGNLNSIPNSSYTIRLYLNPSCDPSGFGEGTALQAEFSVTTNLVGDAPFNDVQPGLPTGFYLTATATDSAGNTSEFSQCRQVVTP